MIAATSQSIVQWVVMGLRDAVSVGAKTYPNKVIVSLSKASWLRISRWTSVIIKFAFESLGTLAEPNLSIRCILASLGCTRRVGTIRLPGKAGTPCPALTFHPTLGLVYCDTKVRTGTPCTFTVRTCTSRTSGQPVIYSHVSLFSRIHRYCSLLCSVML